MLFVLSFGLASTFLFGAPRPAYAQYVDPITSIQTTVSNVWETLKEGLVQGAGVAVLNGANYFLQQLAYQAAVALTADCPGQVVCWDSKSFEAGFEQAWQGAIGEAVGTLSEAGGFDKLGFNLCKPPQLNTEFDFSLNIQLGLLDEVKPPPPKCDWNELKKNYADAANALTTPKLMAGVNLQFKPGQAPLSAGLSARSKILGQSQDAKVEATIKSLTEASAGAGFSGITDPVSGRVKSPPGAVSEEFKRSEAEGKGDKAIEQSGQVTAGQLSSKAVVGVITSAISTFAQTLASRLFNKLVKGLMSTEQLIAGQPDIIMDREALLQPPGRRQQEISLKSQYSFATPKEVGTSDPLLDFSVCPGSGRTSQNCVVDAQFANAVRVSDALPVTVREGIEKGMLHGDWPLIPSSDQSHDQDPYCYTYAYCESNLKKLRALRVIPIGWEIAASLSPASEPVSLKSVMDRFNDCNANGELDSGHPFCHLIDPDWVLKMPPAQCRALVAGPQLLDPAIPTRVDICVDQPTCLKQDDKGNCIGGYGYCTRERNVWRFNGDLCPQQYNSCRTLTPKTGIEPGGSAAQVNFLLNTIDYGVCNADNAGCTANSIEQNPAGTAASQSDDWLTQPALYFNKNTQKCSAGQVGCTSLVKFGPGESLNLIRNGDFESLDDGDADGNPDHPVGWVAPVGAIPDTMTGYVETTGAHSTGGTNSIFLSSTTASGVCQGGSCDSENGCRCSIELSPGQNYTCRVHPDQPSCYYAARLVQDRITLRPNKTHAFTAALKRQGTSGTINVTARFTFRKADGTPVSLSSTGDVTSAPLSTGQTCGVVSGGLQISQSVSADSTTLGCTFAIKDTDVALAMIEFTSAGVGVFVDNVQLEEGGGSSFHTDYGSASERVYAKLPPAYLDCKGDEGDRPECDNFAGVCRETEVGCDLYTPKNGDPAVPGITGPQDTCPAECVGYDSFKLQPTEFDSQTTQQFVYFIPDTARSCSAAEVGCSEFTNLDTEGVEYYTKLRLCQRPDDLDSKVFYSWEGSDTTGYQLKVWNLKESNLTSATSDSDVPADPLASVAGKGPCTKIDAQSNTCIDSSGTTENRAICQRDDIDTGNFDCRELYDADGNRHYRLLSRTILATADCHPYRITQSTNTDCTQTNGKWDVSRLECIYQASGTESLSCGAQVNNCRAYKGNAASNVRSDFIDDFEAGLANWTDGTGGTGNIEQSPESITVGGHSLKVESQFANRDITDFAAAGRSYQVSFWARGADKLTVSMQVGAQYSCKLPSICETSPCPCTAPDRPTCTVAVGQDTCNVPAQPAPVSAAPGAFNPVVTLSSNWRQYSIGPVVLNSPLWTSNRIRLYFSKNTGGDYYLDNVILKEVQDNIYVVRDSWQTPASCDQSADGAPSPLEMLGCREYKNTRNETLTLRSFSSLCRERAVGCTAYSSSLSTVDDPHENSFNAVCDLGSTCKSAPSCVCNYDLRLRSSSASAPTFASPPVSIHDACRVPVGESECRFTFNAWDDSSSASDHPDRINVPADERLYLAVKKQHQCTVDAVGCKELGQPHVAYDGKCTLGSACAADTCTCTDAANGVSCEVARGDSACNVFYENGIIDKWKAVRIKDDSKLYEKSLCLAPSVGCAEFASSTSTVYFKDPGNKVCEFQENVPYGGRTVSGWFRKSEVGARVPCYPELFREGELYEIYRNKDPSCSLSSACDQTGGCPCTAAGASAPTCVVPEGEKVCGFEGWVGLCQEQFDRCEEFIDPASTSPANPVGQPYYYIANEKLDTRSCSGSVSLKQGCVLVKQTSNTRSIYSAAASYLASSKAQGDKVAPVNCDSNPRSTLCENRCYGRANSNCSNDQNKRCASDADCGSGNTCEGVPYWGSGCSDLTNHSDCNRAVGEKCLPAATEPSKFRNDANLVVKVRQDRECAQWLDCRSFDNTWDDQQGKYRRICTSFGLCDSAKKVGQTFECGNYVDDAVEVLSKEKYARRDTTFRGLEYSGYSLAGKYPAQFLVPVNITKGWCFTSANIAVPGTGGLSHKSCYTNDQCGSGNYCSASKAGVCVGTGVPNNADRACDSNDDCRVSAGEYCSRNYLATRRFGVIIAPPTATGSCEKDADCPDDDPTDSRSGNGTCIEHHCTYDLIGGPLRFTNRETLPSCRAYPEQNAPYPKDVLDTSQGDSAGDTAGYNMYGNPVSKKSAFEGANVCARGNDCECAYLKVSYGQGGAYSRYHSLEQPNEERKPGMCSGGLAEGLECDSSADCTAIDVQSSCSRRSGRVQALGWPGFCIDIDRSLNINGDPNQYGCNLWLPVDKLAGVPDSYNQFRQAGFDLASDAQLDSLTYCTEAKQGSDVVLHDDGTEHTCPMSNDDVGTVAAIAAGCGIGAQLAGPAGCLVGGAIAAIADFLSSCNTYLEPKLSGGDMFYDNDVNDGDDDGAIAWEDSRSLTNLALRDQDISAIRIEFGQYDDPKAVFYLFPGDDFYGGDYWAQGSRWRTDGGDDNSASEPRWGWEGTRLSTWEMGPTGGRDGGHGRFENCFEVKKEGGGGDSNVPCRDYANKFGDNPCDGNDDGAGEECRLQDNSSCVLARAKFNSSTRILEKIQTVYCAKNAWSNNLRGRAVALTRPMCTEIAYIGNASGDAPMAMTQTLKTRANLSSIPYAQTIDLYDQYNVTDKTLGIPIAPYGRTEPTAAPSTGVINFTSRIPAPFSPGYEKILPVFKDGGYGGNVQRNAALIKDGNIRWDAGSTAAGNLYARSAPTSSPTLLPDAFVRSWGIYRLDPASRTYLETPGRVGNWDERENQMNLYGGAPVIKPVDTATCVAGVEGLCKETNDPGKFTVCSGSTCTNDTTLNPGSTNGKLKVEIKYYAYADKNHMPLRRKAVDFGDDTAIAWSHGYFKNRRGLMSNGDSYCGSNQPGDWGLSPTACEARYFLETHTYICTRDMIESGKIKACDSKQIYPCSRGGNCIFKPRIQLLDNWEVCNGTCKSINHAGTYCMNTDLVARPLDEMECISGPASQSIDIKAYVKNDQFGRFPDSKPWTEFPGEIVVSP